jgi:hypothetical protein
LPASLPVTLASHSLDPGLSRSILLMLSPIRPDLDPYPEVIREEDREARRATQARQAGLTSPPRSRLLVTPSSPGACLVTSPSS